jgi:hypothetical protein
MRAVVGHREVGRESAAAVDVLDIEYSNHERPRNRVLERAARLHRDRELARIGVDVALDQARVGVLLDEHGVFVTPAHGKGQRRDDEQHNYTYVHGKIPPPGHLTRGGRRGVFIV